MLDEGYKKTLEIPNYIAESITIAMSEYTIDENDVPTPIVCYPVYGNLPTQRELNDQLKGESDVVAYLINVDIWPNIGLQKDSGGIVSYGTFALLLFGKNAKTTVETNIKTFRAMGFVSEKDVPGINTSAPYIRGNVQYWEFAPASRFPLNARDFGDDIYVVETVGRFQARTINDPSTINN